MSERRSRAFLLAEVIVLLIPITLVVFLVAFLALVTIFQNPGDYPSDAAFAASVLSIVCLWRIVLASTIGVGPVYGSFRPVGGRARALGR